jgi:hypothetical protein
MAKIYVDTTRLIDFYEVADDKITQIEELQKHKSSLVLTDQTITEFRRNRIQHITKLHNRLKKTIDDDKPQTVAVVQRLRAFQELTKLYREKAKEVLDYLRKLMDDEKKDPVAQGILKLAADEAVRNLKTSDKIFAKAQRRKLLGNPPCSPDKYTIGDEIIWELLLGLEDDLVVVTRDNTYEENFPVLADEYRQVTGHKLLHVTDKLSEAVAKIGEEPTQDLIAAEEKEEDSLLRAVTQAWQDTYPSLFSALTSPALAGGAGSSLKDRMITDVSNPGFFSAGLLSKKSSAE